MIIANGEPNYGSEQDCLNVARKVYNDFLKDLKDEPGAAKDRMIAQVHKVVRDAFNDGLNQHKEA